MTAESTVEVNILNNGLDLIAEKPYTFKDLKEFIKNTSMAKECEAFLEAEDIVQACEGFLELLKQTLTLETITILFVAACMLYYIQSNLHNRKWRYKLLHKTFEKVDSLNPLHLHIACERMFNNLIGPNQEHLFNLWNVCQQIYTYSRTGKSIAICMAWTLLCKMTDTESNMHRFHRFSEINEMLLYLNKESLQRGEHLEIVYLIVQVVGFLINVIVLGENDDMKESGYKNYYFSYCLGDLKKLEAWTTKIYDSLKLIKSANDYDLVYYILEHLQINIKALLINKIADLEDEALAV